MGVHWKNLVFRGMWFHEKPIYKGDGLKRGGGVGAGAGGRAWTVCKMLFFRGAWQKRGRWCFWGDIDTPNAHYENLTTKTKK